MSPESWDGVLQGITLMPIFLAQLWHMGYKLQVQFLLTYSTSEIEQEKENDNVSGVLHSTEMSEI